MSNIWMLTFTMTNPLNVKHWMSNVEFQTSNVERWMSNVECRTLNFKRWISNIECQTLNFKRRMSNVECRTLNVEHWMSNVECRTSNVERRMSNTVVHIVWTWINRGNATQKPIQKYKFLNQVNARFQRITNATKGVTPNLFAMWLIVFLHYRPGDQMSFRKNRPKCSPNHFSLRG
jgi:hypothetical protein